MVIKGIDAHAHVFKPGLKLAKVRRYAPEYEASIEEFLAHFESKGLDHGLLIQPSFLGTDNSFMVEAIRKNPDKLYGVAVVNPTVIEAGLDELNQHNIIGIRLNLYGKEIPDLTRDEWKPLLQKIKALDWHVELHIDAVELPALVEALLGYGVKVVVDHFGKPNPERLVNDEGFQYLLRKAETKQIWIKISGTYRLNKSAGLQKSIKAAETLIKPLLATYGPERLLWGSDWPHTQFEDRMTYDKSYAIFQQLVPDEQQRQCILVDAFNQLLPGKV